MENSRKKSWKEKKQQKEERAIRFRRIRTPLFTLFGMVFMGFVGFPLLFESMYPISVMTDIAPIATLSPIVTPVPLLQASESTLEQTASSGSTAYLQETIINEVNASTYSTLQYGDDDPFVAKIQLRLMELGYIGGDEPTEHFGPATQAGIKSFQQTHHMNETGIADELTQTLLFSSDAKVYSLEKGNDGSDVTRLQNQLMDLGYYGDKVNGYFGLATERALMAFQTKNRLSVTGTADAETFDLLYSSRAKPAVDPTPTPTPKRTATPKPTTGSSSSKPSTSSTVKPSSGGSITIVGNGLEAFISAALSQEGKPYVLGDEGPNSYDCSGLVYYSLRSAGVSVGRRSAKNYATESSWQTISSYNDLRRGDLLFFTNSGGVGSIGHTGIYLGNGTFIHASSSRASVVISTWSEWCRVNFQWGKRVF